MFHPSSPYAPFYSYYARYDGAARPDFAGRV
jgi:hypothetical protein